MIKMVILYTPGCNKQHWSRDLNSSEGYCRFLTETATNTVYIVQWKWKAWDYVVQKSYHEINRSQHRLTQNLQPHQQSPKPDLAAPADRLYNRLSFVFGTLTDNWSTDLYPNYCSNSLYTRFDICKHPLNYTKTKRKTILNASLAEGNVTVLCSSGWSA